MVIKRVKVEDLELLVMISIEHELTNISVNGSVDGEAKAEEVVDEGGAERGGSIHNTHNVGSMVG